MKNREPMLASYPTTAELYALERAARLERTREMARVLGAALSRVKKLLSAPKGLRHA